MTTTTEAAALARVSFRRVDYWIRSGLVPGVAINSGSGNVRSLTNDQVRFLTMMADLVRVGMKPDKAAELVQELLRTGTVHVGSWIRIEKV